LSKIYAGTGALNTSVTRTGKRTLGGEQKWRTFHEFLILCSLGMLADATKSVSRAYINNFQDGAKQMAIDMFLVSKPVQTPLILSDPIQGNLTAQKPVTIFDPIHDSVRAALNAR
jgi:hypothetical protein